MTIHWKAVVPYFTVHVVCNFGNFISFGLETVRRERVKLT